MKKLLTTITLLATCASSFAAEAPKKPNVLFIIADDLNTALSGFGHPDCKTPNLDKLASRGVKFTSMHCQFPLCGPSRASIMTGLYPDANGVILNTWKRNLPGMVTMSELFRKNGYFSQRVSKIYHMNIPHDIYSGKPVVEDKQSWDNAVNVKSPEWESTGKLENLTPKFGGVVRSQSFLSIQTDGSDSDQADGIAADKAIDFLKKQSKDKPFFLALGFVRPHVPLIAPAKYYTPYDPAKLKLPVVPADDLKDLPAITRNYNTDSRFGVTNPEQHRKILQAYYASVSYMDAQAGRVLQALDDLKLRDNTIVVFTSDHGYMLGEHHKWQKVSLFEETTRVPFIVSVPWMKKAHGTSSKKITELVDLYPTLADLAGLKLPYQLSGTSLKPLLQDPASKEWKKDNALTISIDGGVTLRTQDWRYTRWNHKQGGQELYDLKNDPGEHHNLANDPKHEPTRAKLRAQLAERRKAAMVRPVIK